MTPATTPDPTLAIPEGLSAAGKKAARVILKRLAEASLTGRVYTGGCTLFRTPADAAARGREYGKGSLLIVTYDGGDARDHFAYNGESVTYRERMENALEAAGFRVEACTCWYSAVYAA